jgi:hypothetical protein
MTAGGIVAIIIAGSMTITMIGIIVVCSILIWRDK